METGHADHGTLKSYLTGFALAVVLTVAAFFVVMHPAMPRTAIIAVILALAVVQILVHLTYFLHMSLRRDNRWNLLSLVFTVLILALIVGGSLWIMHNMITTLMASPSVMPHG